MFINNVSGDANNTEGIGSIYSFKLISYALSQIYKIGSVQKPLSIYRNHSSSYSNKRIKIYIDELKSWIKKNEENLKKKGFKITDQKIYLYKLQLKYFFKSFFKF